MFENTQSLPIPLDILGREDLTLSEKIVYSILRYRFNLSVANPKFKDDQGIFIFFEQKDIMKMAAMAQRTVEKAMTKLKEVGLIDRSKHRRTFKIYLKPYQVDEKYIIAEKAANESQVDETGIDPSVTPQETSKPLEGQNESNLPIVDKVVDNLGMVEDVENAIHAKNTPIDEIHAKNTPILKIHAKNTPKNNTLYNNTLNNKKNNNNLTLLKGHKPKVEIDYDLYITFNKCFNKKPNTLVKNEINSLIARGIEKDLIIDLMEIAGGNTWSWAYVTKELSKLIKEGIMTLDAYLTKQAVSEGMIAVPTEWVGVEQLIYI